MSAATPQPTRRYGPEADSRTPGSNACDNAIAASVKELCDAVRVWQAEHGERRPERYSQNDLERSLGCRVHKLLLRCNKPIVAGRKVLSKLSEAERVLVERLPGFLPLAIEVSQVRGSSCDFTRCERAHSNPGPSAAAEVPGDQRKRSASTQSGEGRETKRKNGKPSKAARARVRVPLCEKYFIARSELAAIFTIRKVYAEAIFRGTKLWEGRPDGAPGAQRVKPGCNIAFRFGGMCRSHPRIVVKVAEIRHFPGPREMLLDLGISRLLPTLDGDLEGAVAVYHALGPAYHHGMVAFRLEGLAWEDEAS